MPEQTEPNFQAWRRPKDDSRGVWKPVPDLPPGGKVAVFEAVQRELWKAYEVEYEYAILPVGQVPPMRANGMGVMREAFSHRYRTKVMRPR